MQPGFAVRVCVAAVTLPWLLQAHPLSAQAGSWSLIATPSAAPGSRGASAMAYDGTAGVALLFGGSAAGNLFADTWSWDGKSWRPLTHSITAVSSNGPAARQNHAMASDARGRVVLFGGTDGATVMSDTWQWNGASWIAVGDGMPPAARWGHAMAYDSARQKTVLFGGYSSVIGVGSLLGDTWEWDGRSWTQVAASGPEPRARSAMAYDAARGRTVLFGGVGQAGVMGDAWEWDGTAWLQMDAGGNGPGARERAVMAGDEAGAHVLLYGGENGDARYADTWAWNGTKWLQLAVTDPGVRSEPAMVDDPGRARVVLFGGFLSPGDTWEWASTCDDEAAPLDERGAVIFPSNLDPSEPPVYEDIDQKAGNVGDLYQGIDTTTDTWYSKFACNPSIGGTVPPAAASPYLPAQLAALGIPVVSPQEMSDTLVGWEDAIARKAASEPDRLARAKRATGPYTPPAKPHCKATGCAYVFGGRDLVFIHGLDLGPIFDKIFGTNPAADAKWRSPGSSPGYLFNPEFYKVNNHYGYFKQNADAYWEEYIKHFLAARGIMNRYVTVAYASTERLDIGAQAILTQIGDAMRSGIGVVDPSGKNDTSGFGTPSFVVISHSTGGLITDVAMTAAVSDRNLHAQFIPRFCKANIALDAVFSGSRLATAAVVAAGYITVNSPPPWLCPLANLALLAFNATGSQNPLLSCPPNFAAVLDSILIDLVPAASQLKWGSSVRLSPVRTLTLVGGHPSYVAPLKDVLHPGFDDGVSTINSQVANPHSLLLWPSGFAPSSPFGLIRVFDMGVWRTYPLRAIYYYVDQVVDPRFNPLFPLPFVAAGATPYVSPTGMLEPVGLALENTGYDALARYPNHFSFVQSAADHSGGSVGLGPSSDHPDGYNGVYYRNTFGEHNLEETRVITDPAVYQPYAMFYPGDDEPLLNAATVPAVEEVVRGRKLTFKIRFFGHTYRKSWWIWKRRYHLMVGWQDKVAMDYLFGAALAKGGSPPCPPPGPADDCNHNGIPDECDIANGTSKDCNLNHIPDECETIKKPAIIGQPADTSVVEGQQATFSVSALGSGPLSYQWRRNGFDLVDDGRIVGARSNVLSIFPTMPADAGVYDVIASSCGSIQSAVAHLVIIARFCELDPGMVNAHNTYLRRITLAQTFKPAHSGVLTGVIHGLEELSDSAPSFNLYITTTTADGRPAWPGGVLYAAKGLSAFSTAGQVNGLVAVTNGPHLLASTRYALVLEPGVPGPGIMAWRGNSGASSYPNGSAYELDPQGSWVVPTVGPKVHGFKLEGRCDH